ncbi:hypothetical protein [Achromobacter insolitus]|uniref:hypothetical protein n=1 Tax=Achromobacter insolitus TaxID=217204 RepID=UPI00174A95F2|nr:hypothetical protein [Achromobacter insolitus]
MAGLSKVVVDAMGRKDLNDQEKRCWTVGCLLADEEAEKSKFQRSVEAHVDDAEKKRNFTTMVGALFEAVCSQDYQGALEGGAVTCKPAHSFKFDGHTHTIWELKEGKKDRIYFFRKPGWNVLVLFLAFHKKDRQTPDEVKNICEPAARQLLREKGRPKFC